MKKSLLYTALFCAGSALAHDNNLEHIVVLAPMQSPIHVHTDPKLPRQPLPAQDGADLLSSISGFSLIKKGGASADPTFRGMAGSRLNIIANGGPTLGGCGGRMDPPTAYITPQSYDSLKVIKGPQTVLYGSGNSAATVVFERDQTRMEKQRIEGFVNVVLGSAQRQGLNTDIKAGNRDYYVRATGNIAKADDYEDGSNTVIHSNYKRWNGDIELAYTPEDDKTISITYGRSDGEVAYADRMMDGSLFDRTHANIKIDWTIASAVVKSIESQIYYNYVDHIMDNYSLRTFTPTMMMANPMASNPDRRSQGGKLVVNVDLGTQHHIIMGVDHHQDRHRNRMSRSALISPVENKARIKDGEFEKTGIFAEYEYRLARDQQIVSGLRIDRWQATDYRSRLSMMKNTILNPTANLTRKETLWSGFSRYQLQDSNTSYFAGFGLTERFPDYWELIGGNRQAIDSLSAFNIQAEQTQQLDLGLTHQTKQWTSSISLFFNRIDDYILIDNAYGVVDMPKRVVRNIDAQTYGFEMDNKVNLSKNWIAGASINYVRGRNLSDDTPLAQQPPLQGRFTLDYQAKSWRTGLLWRLVAKQDRIAVDQGNIAGQDVDTSTGFGVLSVNASYSQSDDLEWSVGIDNLLNKTYAEHLSRSGSMVNGYEQVAKVNEVGMTLWANLNWRF